MLAFGVKHIPASASSTRCIQQAIEQESNLRLLTGPKLSVSLAQTVTWLSHYFS